MSRDEFLRHFEECDLVGGMGDWRGTWRINEIGNITVKFERHDPGSDEWDDEIFSLPFKDFYLAMMQIVDDKWNPEKVKWNPNYIDGEPAFTIAEGLILHDISYNKGIQDYWVQHVRQNGVKTELPQPGYNRRRI